MLQMPLKQFLKLFSTVEIKEKYINPTLWAMNQESPHYSLEQQLHSQPERIWQNKIFQISKKKRQKAKRTGL